MQNAYKWCEEKKKKILLLHLSHGFIEENCVFSLEGIQKGKWKDKLIVTTVRITWTNILWEMGQNIRAVKFSSLLALLILSGFLLGSKFISTMKF